MAEQTQHPGPEPTSHAGNGILARVPGEYIGQTIRTLPDPALTAAEELQFEVDAGWAGRVRLTFVKHRYRRPKGKFSSVSWTCRHAEQVLGDAVALGKSSEPGTASSSNLSGV